MPTYTGTQMARSALREIGVLDPIENGTAELLNDALEVGGDLLDAWRLEKLLIPSITRSVYSLATLTQDYTIGSGGTFNQDYPTAIECWSVIPDDTAADLLELPMGRPLTYDQWQMVRIKSQRGSYPLRMYFDHAYAAGLGTCSFHPKPTGAHVDVALYSAIPALTTLAAGTQYNLRPGYARAIKTNWAIELADRHGREITAKLEKRAMQSKAAIKISNYRPTEARSRAEFDIGGGSSRRTFNIYQGS